ncbi:phosphatase PAP2/dual specificity phosphatase family protein [Terrarubrum flagellatum]|uniref:phosphatase PAP2/dual specificity phosphatase family protein n=1 Tax=Terrirubrum flagellatum TaxID=2895980 RepID=UPI003145671E
MKDLAAGVERRPIGRAFVWLAALGVFFYASYGLANWLATLRAHVPSIVFSWERSVPFIAWTIIPYWTTNLFYSLSFFICRNRRELDAHGRRLLTAQIIAVTCFILLPLKFSWPKPDTDGIAGFFFETLGAFDKPFNQAPSLHVALSIALFSLYARILPRWATIALSAWFVLVVASVMTTFQHHFIDIPTGALLGLFCIWLWPLEGGARLTGWQVTHDARRRTLALRYMIAAAFFAAAGLALHGGWLWLLWPAFAFLGVSAAYLALGPALFDKTPDGRIGWPVRLMLAPYLIGAWINSRLWTIGTPRAVAVADGVFLGRFPSRRDLEAFGEVVDLTSELSRPRFAGVWTSLPMLDLAAPPADRLRAAARVIESARAQRSTLVCCALGYGRSVLAVAVWLTRTGRADTLDAAIAMLRAKRPRLSIHPDQLRAAREAVDGDR